MESPLSCSGPWRTPPSTNWNRMQDTILFTACVLVTFFSFIGHLCGERLSILFKRASRGGQDFIWAYSCPHVTDLSAGSGIARPSSVSRRPQRQPLSPFALTCVVCVFAMMNYATVNDPPAQSAALATNDEEILENIDGRIHGPMSGFITKFFGAFQYIRQNDENVLEIQAAGEVIGRCAVPKAAPSPNSFLQWFSEYTSQEIDGARGSWHISSGKVTPGNETAEDGARLLLTMPPSSASNDPTRWDHVQVVGQFYHSCRVGYQQGLLRLCRSVYKVFDSQPTRLFLHAFYIRGSLIELWAFDRSGLYCSNTFDIRGDFIQFLSITLTYQRMADLDLGKPNFIEADKGGSYIALDRECAKTPSLKKLYLESQPIASDDLLVGSGTTCYQARVPDSNRWNYILKFSWRWARNRPENELLNIVEKKSVWGAVSLDYFKEIESTANLRRGLRWGPYKTFAGTKPCERQESDQEQQDARGSSDGLLACTEESNNYLQNRILTSIITSPLGRPLYTFRSPTELLQVLCDAVKCHRSLYYEASILHQDISQGNIVILDDQGEGKPKGILIDLDSALELTEGSETHYGITGTKPYMAIGVLKSEPHTYRHDLESFFYVFLRVIVANREEDPPTASKLRQWSKGGWDELAALKSFNMSQGGFESILKEFTPEFHYLKPLAERLRRTLFPIRDGVIWTGTDSSPKATEQLYDGIIHAFEEFIGFQGATYT